MDAYTLTSLKKAKVTGPNSNFLQFFALNCFYQVRQKVLSSAFMRAIKDPFPPARQAGVLAMAATHNLFTLQEASMRLLPALCMLTMDPEKGVRDQVSKENNLSSC